MAHTFSNSVPLYTLKNGIPQDQRMPQHVSLKQSPIAPLELCRHIEDGDEALTAAVEDLRGKMAKHIADQRDQACILALNAELGTTGWTLKDIMPRCAMVLEPTGDQVLTLDGQPILRLKPIEIERQGMLLRTRQPYERLAKR